MTKRDTTPGSILFKSPTATGLVLLFLSWHAFLVTATHFHRDVRPVAAQATATHGLSAAPGDGDAQPGAAASHAQCLLCRLQRNFICDLEQGIPAALVPPASKLSRAVHIDSAHTRTSFLKPSGRAPPTT